MFRLWSEWQWTKRLVTRLLTLLVCTTTRQHARQTLHCDTRITNMLPSYHRCRNCRQYQDLPFHMTTKECLSKDLRLLALAHSDRLLSPCLPSSPLIKLSVTEHSQCVSHNNWETHSRKPSEHQTMLLYLKNGRKHTCLSRHHRRLHIICPRNTF